MTRILGLDPGSSTTGYVVLDGEDLLDFGTIRKRTTAASLWPLVGECVSLARVSRCRVACWDSWGYRYNQAVRFSRLQEALRNELSAAFCRHGIRTMQVFADEVKRKWPRKDLMLLYPRLRNEHERDACRHALEAKVQLAMKVIRRM